MALYRAGAAENERKAGDNKALVNTELIFPREPRVLEDDPSAFSYPESIRAENKPNTLILSGVCEDRKRKS